MQADKLPVLYAVQEYYEPVGVMRTDGRDKLLRGVQSSSRRVYQEIVTRLPGAGLNTPKGGSEEVGGDQGNEQSQRSGYMWKLQTRTEFERFLVAVGDRVPGG